MYQLPLLICAQVNPDEESRQRLRLIRGEIDAPMKASRPERTAQDDLAGTNGQAAPAAATGETPIKEAAAVSAPEDAGGAAAPAAEDDSDEEDLNGADRRDLLTLGHCPLLLVRKTKHVKQCIMGWPWHMMTALQGEFLLCIWRKTLRSTGCASLAKCMHVQAWCFSNDQELVCRILRLGVHCGHTEGADPTAGMGPRQKKLWELQQKLRASRKANQDAMVAEKRRQARPEGAEEAGEKRKWYEEKKARREADLKRMNLDEKKVCS